MKIRFAAAGLFVVAGFALAGAAASERSDLVVHEWGTFLAMNGSDGIALDGMYHEEHALPAFVHSRSKDQLKLRSVIVKGETPVIYFYTQRPQQVAVRVDFPGGIWTQWYPQAALVGPALVQIGTPPRPRNGHISWTLDVVPPQLAHGEPPATTTDALWNHARRVDAAYVSAFDQTRLAAAAPREWERFIFYRGLGEAKLPLEMSAHDGKIAAHATEGVDIRHLYVVRVEQGRGAYAYIPALGEGNELKTAIPAMDTAMPIDRFADTIAGDMAQRLVETGLYEKEARAMVNTWRSSYFKTDGVRVLFVLPQSWTDRYIPLRIDPKPAETVRVMVGRVELLTPERERRAEIAVRDLGSPDEGVRERAFATLRDEGRYVEPIVRHTLRTSADERVQTLARRLLLTDFITELRTALTHAASGEKLPQNPIYARAQLASLLREVGLTQEAKQEGEAALAALGHVPPPDMRNHDSRHVYRAVARAHEGAGHDAEAMGWYGDFVTFGSRMQTCAGACHRDTEGPRDMTFFRDWWAGRKFADYAVKTGDAPRLIAAHEATLAQHPDNVAAQLSLAYLYAARGDSAAAERLWSRIDP